MNNKKIRFGYEDTDKSIEIELYGLVFKVNVKNKDIEDLKNIRDNVSLEELEGIINKYLGRNAVNEINRQRKQDGYNVIDEDIATQIIICIMRAYTNTMLSGLTDTMDDIDGKINNTIENVNKVKQFNRYERRNYNRRGNYRRY